MEPRVSLCRAIWTFRALTFGLVNRSSAGGSEESAQTVVATSLGSESMGMPSSANRRPVLVGGGAGTGCRSRRNGFSDGHGYLAPWRGASQLTPRPIHAILAAHRQ